MSTDFETGAFVDRPAVARGGRARLAWISLAIAALTLAVFLPAVRCGFINCDDNEYVTDNPHVSSGLNWANVRWAFTSAHSSNWHPLTWISLAVDATLFGRWPGGFHLTNVLLHALDAVLLFCLLMELTGATWRGAMVAALFALHPLRVESVAWVAERKDVLSACFGFLSLICYARFAGKSRVESPGAKVFYALALFFFACGLMSKPMLVTWPFVLLLLDWWLLNRIRNWKSLVAEKIPFFALSAASCAVTFVVQQRSGIVQPLAGLPVGDRVGNAAVSYVRYLGKMFWPADLVFPYPHPGHWPLKIVAASILILLAASAAVLAGGKARRYLLAGWLWYLGLLVPVIGLVQVGTQAMADHYTYLPLIGIFVMLVWLADELAARLNLPKMVCGGCAVLVLAVCACCTARQLDHWRDSGVLFGRSAALTKNNFIAHKLLGDWLVARGEADGAAEHYRASLKIMPGYVAARNNLGLVLARQGRVAEAEEHFLAVLRVAPDSVEAHNNLGYLLVSAGRLDEARTNLMAALRGDPSNAEAHGNLGNAFSLQHCYAEAIVEYSHALELKPDDAQVRNNLGAALEVAGRLDDAVAQYREALRCDANFADAQKNLGIALVGRRQFAEALPLLRAALARWPDDARLDYNFGLALAGCGNFESAAGFVEAALRSSTNDPVAHYNLAVILAKCSRTGEAIKHYEAAIALKPDYANAHFHLGCLLADAGERERAAGELNEALRLKPDLKDAAARLEKLNRR